MRRQSRTVAFVALAAMLVAVLMASVASPPAQAQDIDPILDELERTGYYIEPGAEGSDARFADLVRQAEGVSDRWYFVSMADTVSESFADDLFVEVSPAGNVLVYFLDGEFVNVQLATESSESVESQALSAFDGDWDQPEDFMADVVADYESLTASASSSGSGATTSSGTGSSSSGGGGFPWGLLAIPAVLGGGIWFMSRRGKKKKEDDALETARKIRAELQTEIDELANDVLVLSSPVDVSDKPQAVEYYREATDTYLDISDEIPDMDELEHADLAELSDFGARVAHARWQMDAAEAIMDGEPLPEKPKVEPPPPPPQPPKQRTPEQRRQRMPQRAPRARVPYSPSRRRSGGGLLDVLIAGAGMMGSTRGRSRGRSAGGMFGSGSRGRTSPARQSTPRPGGGVFGGSSRSRGSSRSSSNRSRSGSTSRSSSRRRSSSGRSTSKRRRR